jgi:hypothetical protein
MVLADCSAVSASISQAGSHVVPSNDQEEQSSFQTITPLQAQTMRSIPTLLASLAITSTLASPSIGKGRNRPHHPNPLTAHTKTGTFTGFIDPEVPDVRQWLGVPYGAPPIGDQRFLPPKPAAYAGDVAATEYKPICMQNGGPGPGVFWEVVPEFQNTDKQDEDCLFLNIWGPRGEVGSGRRQRRKEKVPVIIWSRLMADLRDR